MSGLAITDLRPPPRRYCIDRRTDRADGVVGFEPTAECLAEDQRRGKEITTSAAGITDPGSRLKALRLGKQLSVQGRDRQGNLQHVSGASRLHMRDLRINISGAVWELAAPLKRRKVGFFTVAIPAWSVKSEELDRFDPVAMLNSFRVDLNRAAKAIGTTLANTSGWAFTAIHGEFDATTGRFQLHVHGIATRGMITVVGALGKVGTRGKYVSSRATIGADADDYVAQKVRTIRDVKSLSSTISYCLKSYWPSDPSYVAEDGARQRLHQKQRITGIHQTRYLMWLDRHPLKHLVLLVHLRVTREGLKATR